jgi:lysophospholipase L1-like esterase
VKTPRAGLWVRRLGLAALAALLPLLLLEAAVRTFGPFLPGSYRLGGFIRSDPVYGYFHVASAQSWIRASEFVARVTTNSIGLRDGEVALPKPPGTYRILAVGDSYVEGYGVSDGQPFADLLEQQLNARQPAGPRPTRYDVVNGGVYAWGPGNEYLWLRQVGLQLQPDLVVVHLFLWNDLTDNACDIYTINARHRVCLFLDGDGQMQQKPLVPAPSPAAAVLGFRLRDYSQLYGMVDNSLSDWMQQTESESGNSQPWQRERRRMAINLFALSLPSRERKLWDESWWVRSALLEAMKRDVEQAGARLAVVAIPGPVQLYPERLDRAVAEFGLDRAQFDIDYPTGRLADLVSKLGVPYLDLTPAMRAEATSSKTPLVYPNDGHFTADGHRVAARELRAFLETRLELSR